MEVRRLWSADHEPDRRPRAADPDRWPARADAPGDGGVRRRGARRLPGPGPPAAGARNLHVVATEERFPAPVGQEVELSGQVNGLAWGLRFFDPVVLPVLGLVAESEGPAPEEVRRALGIRTYLYHLVVEPGSQLTPHHATHAGTATDLQPDALRAALLQALRGGGTTTTESR